MPKRYLATFLDNFSTNQDTLTWMLVCQQQFSLLIDLLGNSSPD